MSEQGRSECVGCGIVAFMFGILPGHFVQGISMFASQWVIDGQKTWGLYEWCVPIYQNATQENETDCSKIPPGQSPGK